MLFFAHIPFMVNREPCLFDCKPRLIRFFSSFRAAYNQRRLKIKGGLQSRAAYKSFSLPYRKLWMTLSFLWRSGDGVTCKSMVVGRWCP